jgi:hypothetical protein
MSDYECYCEPMEPDEPSDVWTVTWHKARKEHKCHECGEFIKKGNRYERIFSVFDGSAVAYKTCEFCANEYQRLLSKHPDLSWVKGELACVLVWDMRNEYRALETA